MIRFLLLLGLLLYLIASGLGTLMLASAKEAKEECVTSDEFYAYSFHWRTKGAVVKANEFTGEEAVQFIEVFNGALKTRVTADTVVVYNDNVYPVVILIFFQNGCASGGLVPNAREYNMVMERMGLSYRKSPIENKDGIYPLHK